ncbi:amino acid adenylation domain-containing protein [Undibacterium sp. CY18W]|uniref:Amino acid adenylation domain-containing protein n=1 Tax=Undibacterium hunanense TaxID=2762292 RepID=A0ABR6ZMN4_9BURK|nr:non-ribosomal peptide synthetase/type I polyketide synthase [Undibacterium hunanense]MBC3917143.1 amino acid adenylation domain-containing protein [Undibacterium hunanense]
MIPAPAISLRQHATLVDWIEHHAKHRPDAEALCFIGQRNDVNGATNDLRLTYADLSERVRCCAASLQRHARPGDSALILFPSGIDYVVALLACFYAGVTGVPVNLPGAARVKRVLPKLGDITRDCRPALLISNSQVAAASGSDLQVFADEHELRLLQLEDMQEDDSQRWQRPQLDGAALAFLQYTSGSTGQPKGVINRHGPLLHNLEFLGRLTAVNTRTASDTVIASWLPLFHDLGLIMGILLPLAYGGRAVYMAPMAFAADPLRWLELATRERATALPCPSFALRLCADEARTAPQRMLAIDLKQVTCLMPAAEPVLPAQVESFYAIFGAHGLQRDAIKPAYGLAEATLLVSAHVDRHNPYFIDVDKAKLERGHAVVSAVHDEHIAAGLRRYTSNGNDFGGQDVRIVDAESHVDLGEDQVGEIWINGPAVAGGYWNKPELNRDIFAACIASININEEDCKPYLRTGDMGFMHQGHLFVTGRLKDMLLFRGQCHYPNDIEATSGRSHEAAVPESGAAFSVTPGDEDAECLVIVQEILKQTGVDYQHIVNTIRASVAEEHQLSSHAIVLIRKGTLPRTTSGKVRRAAVRQAYLDGSLPVLHQHVLDTQQAQQISRDISLLDTLRPLSLAQRHLHLRTWLANETAAILGTVAARAIHPEASLFNYGLDSMSAARLVSTAANACGLTLPDSLIFDHPSLMQLAAWLQIAMLDQAGLPPAADAISSSHSASIHSTSAPDADKGVAAPVSTDREAIAVIGMAFRLPGQDGQDASDDAAFWDMLEQGGCAIRPAPSERFRTREDIPGFGAYLNHVDQFDAAFFGMSPREAMNTDPQQRLLLEVAWHALEDAGQRPAALRGSDTGVFVGIGTGDYGHLPFISGEPSHFDAYWGTGTSFAAACGRLSFSFGWEGPSMAVDTACSASHSALHLAVQSLRARESGLSLAAGVKLQLLPEVDLVLHKAGMLAADGRCKTLDARADGYVRGEGCVVLVLKRLSDALADGDAVRAVIRDTTVRQDGAGSSLSAPNGAAQQRLLTLALKKAGLTPADIDYIELHGTGTRLGDPIEYQSVADVFRGRAIDDPLWLGSVKTNIGHLEAAAGAAGLVKTILAIEHGKLPPAVELHEVNPLIDLDIIPARVPAQTINWPMRQALRRAGVTSYGFAGTIAHVLLEQAPVLAAVTTSSVISEPTQITTPQLFLLSARSAESLRMLASSHVANLPACDDLPALARGMARQREHHGMRVAVLASSREELATGLQQLSASRHAVTEAARNPRIGFLFTGQGSQYSGMARDLYAQQPDFRQALDAADAAMARDLGMSVVALMHDDSYNERLQQTAFAQPALFALGYALAKMWQAFGVQPDIILGHSIGEFAGMVIAGALTLEQAASLIIRRGALMQALPSGGAMLAARATPEQALAVLAELKAVKTGQADDIAIAAFNGPQDVVFSGSAAAIDAVQALLTARQLHARALQVSHAFHSPLLDPMLSAWESACAKQLMQVPRIAVCSSLTAELLEQAPDAAYWRNHARQPVRFDDALKRVASACDILLEIGPNAILSAVSQRNQAAQQWPQAVTCLASLRRGGSDLVAIGDACAALYIAGQDFDWAHVFSGKLPSPRSLPRYPFERQSYWLDYDDDAPHQSLQMQPQPERAAARPVDLYTMQWEHFTLTENATHAPRYFLLGGNIADTSTFAAELQATGADIYLLTAGEWPVAATQLQDTDVVIYLDGWRTQTAHAALSADQSGWQLTEFVKVLQSLEKKPRILLPTKAGQAIAGTPGDPSQATLWGAARALALEYAGPRWLMADSDVGLTPLVSALPALLTLFGSEEAVALREGRWLHPRLDRVSAPSSEKNSLPVLKQDGIYLVAGAYGALGRHATDWLATRGARHLVLLARHAAPSGWQARLALLKAQGIRITHIAADVADADDMARVFVRISSMEHDTGHKLAGVFHCAGTSRFNDLATITSEDYSTVSRAKIQGAWLLHEHTVSRALDYFVCFTSISGIWGSRLQIPYGAANAFQDALARLRHHQGLPALAIAWGPWGGGAGMSEVDEDLLQLLRAAGIRRLAPARYLATLDHLLGGVLDGEKNITDDGTCVAVDVDWQQFVPLYALYNPANTFQRCLTASQASAMAVSATTDTPSALHALDEQARQTAVHVFVIAELARTLRVTPAQLTPDIQLLKLGMDSILVMDFSRRCEAGLGVKCELKAIFERNTPQGLTDYLLEQLSRQVPDSHNQLAAEQIIADPANANAPFPLTELQHAYWIGRHSHYGLGGVACHAYLEADAPDGLDLALLERCWNMLVARHGALRLVIGEDGQQRVLPHVPAYAVHTADLRDATQTAVDTHCTEWRETMSHQVMDAAQWPLFDLRASRLPGGAVRLHIGIDMLINDATSGQIIWEELAALYQAKADLQLAGLLPFQISFRDYVLAKYTHSTQRRAERESARKFWLERIPALPSAPQLPLRAEALRQTSPVFSRRQQQLAAPLWQSLREQAAQAGCTPASLLIAVFAEVLAAWSAEPQFTLNLTIFDRLPWHADVPRLLGDFTAVTLLPLDCSDALPFGQRAAAVNGTVLEHLQHRAFSAVDVMREWNRGRERQDAIAMPVVFTSQLSMSDPTKGAAPDSALGTVVYGISQTPQVWLDHQACELDGALMYNWDAVDALFQPGTLDAMFNAYHAILEKLATQPQAWQQALPNLLPPAQQAIRAQVNASAATIPEHCLDQLFFEQAHHTPRAIALIAHEQQWSYAELADWSLRLTQALLQHDVKRSDRIAIVMRKGPEQVAACLGILAAACVYVPVDADVPAARLQAILDGSHIKLVLTQTDCLPIVQEMCAGRDVAVLDASYAAAQVWPVNVPQVERAVTDHAYVIYTSGSTGIPKGVLIDHRGAANTVLDINRRFDIVHTDRVLGLSSLYFDLSVYDLFGIFAVGAALVLPAASGTRDPAHWLDLLLRHRITVWNSVPALLELLLDEADAAGTSLVGLRQVFLSGDWIALGLPARLRAQAPQARLVAMGGATEASIWSNWFIVPEALPAQWRSIPYGYPLANQHYRVLDTRLRDCPDHVSGDLYIGGIGLAVAYENDPDRTDASFIIHPVHGERLYRTGDLARYWGDGTLEFLGRRDFQVKIAGNRIELGEIESALLSHPGVREAVADAVGPARGNKRLAAWVVPDTADTSLYDAFDGNPALHAQRWDAVMQAARKTFEQASALSAAQQLQQGQQSQELEQFWALMDHAGQCMMRDTLLAAGLKFGLTSDLTSGDADTDHIMRMLAPAPDLLVLAQRWLSTLDFNVPYDSEAAWNKLTPAALDFGLSRTVLQRLRSGAGQRLEVLRGHSSALEVFYGADDTLAPEQMTRMNPLSGLCISALAAAIRKLAQHQGHAVRILEIGARSGAATRDLLAQLSDCPINYTLTDPARSLVEQAEQAFSAQDANPLHTIHCRVFEHERAAATQGMPEYEFDVVIAFNALHRSRNIPVLLRRLRSLLNAGGLLLAPEITRNSDFQLATVALLEGGYTQFEDCRQVNGLALLPEDAWRLELMQAGFAATATSGIGADAGMHLLAARQTDTVLRFAPRRLIEHLATLLPAYMVPQTIVELDALPLSATGKVMRQQLPRPEMGSTRRIARNTNSDTSPPANDLLRIWQELLGVADLHGDDDFFDLGGDSLIAVRLIERVRHGMNAHVALSDLFDASSLSAFAERVANAAPYEDNLPPLLTDPAARYAPFPLTDVQQAYWIGRDESFELGGVSTHLYAEIEVEQLALADLERGWQQVVARHDMLRAVINADGTQQVVQDLPVYSIVSHDLRQANAVEVSEWLEIARLELSHEVFDTARWPLFTVRAAQMTDSRVRLFVSLDNLVCDGRSMRTLLAEWAQFARDPGLQLPPLTASFRDYVMLTQQIELLPSYQRSLAYWHDKLSTLAPAPALPLTQYQREDVSPPRFTRREASLTPQATQGLQAQAAAHGVTVNAILLAAYGEVLANWSAIQRFTLNLTLFNRPPVHEEIDALVGDFTSLVLLGFDAGVTASFAERAFSMQRQIWADLEHMQVSAVRVLRETARRNRRLNQVAMPVVFTSGLGLNLASDGAAELDWLGEFVYGISQTPQVWIDQQVVERDGAMVFNWDSVDALFPDGLLDDMFQAYHKLLLNLAQHSDAWQSNVVMPENRWSAAPVTAATAATSISTTASPDTAPVIDDQLLRAVSSHLAALLGHDELAPQTNFFELGATSLDLIRLRQQLQAETGLALSITEVFQHTSIASLAAHLRSLDQSLPSEDASNDEAGQARKRQRLENERRRKRSQQSRA